MNYFTKNVFLLSLSLFMTNALTAQFYTEDFGDQAAAEANWIGGGTNPGAEVWTWTTDAGNPTFGSQPDFASPTAANGFFQFNSDANGENAHDITLTGPAIDCSGQSIVLASFQNQYAFFTQGGGSAVSLGVSTDGTNFNYYPVLENVEQNDLSDAVQTAVVDITADAAGQATVYLQFKWVGNYEYAWKIDDIALSAEDPTPPHELVVDGSQFAPNYLQPSSQLDTIGFQLFVDNMGSMPQTGVNATGEILINGASVFSTSAGLDEILLEANDTLIEMPERYIIEGDGVHTIRYTVTQDSTDINASNNITSREFEVAPGLFSKDDGQIVSATQPGSVADVWEIGNYYYVLNGGFTATEIFFSVASNDNAHQGQTVTIKLYQITEDSDPSDFTDDDVSLVGIGQYEFTNEANFDVVSVVPESLLTGEEGVVLEADTEYFVMIAYTADMFAPYSAIPYYFQVGTVINDGDWFLGGFGVDNTVLARMAISADGVAIEETQLSDDNKIEVYPNPATEMLTLDIDLTTNAFQSTIRIVDAAGKMTYKNVLENIQTEKLDIDVSQYPAGAYMLHFTTENGVKTKRFVVAK